MSPKRPPKSVTPHGPPADKAAPGIVFVHPAPAPSFIPFPTSGRLLLGRDPAAGIPLDGSAVSWQHAELTTNDAGETFIRDLDSTNGVMVRGQRVREARLEAGALVRIGDFLGVVAGTPDVPSSAEVFPEAERIGLVVGPVLGQTLAPLRKLVAGRGALITVEGETGTGKSLVGRLIHARVRPEGPFASIDAASIDDGPGLDHMLAQASSGAVYLYNFTSLPPATQTRLADVLRGKGAGKLCIVAGSQIPLGHAVSGGDLLPGLFEAFAARTLALPPLRERMLEIPLLFRQLLALLGPSKPARSKSRGPTLSTELVERLCLYDWPCNVREMVLIAQRLLALHGDEPRLRVSHLPARLMPPDREGTTLPVAPVVSGVDVSKLLDAVRDSGGNIGGAALRLGITRERAYRLIDRLGLVRGSA